MAERKNTVIITGAVGFMGRALTARLVQRWDVVGLDISAPKSMPPNATFSQVDLSSDDSVRQALRSICRRHGTSIASVVHLAAYFDLTGEPNPKYDEITVGGTERLLRELQLFDVEQFIFASSMLAHKPARPGERISEEWPLESKLPYRDSKIKTERLIHDKRRAIPVVYMRPAGVYDDLCRNPFIAQQIARIYEQDPKGHVYPGDLLTGQSFLHLDDLVDAVVRIIERRKELGPETAILLGEPEAIGYGELQREIGHLIRGEDWQTWEIPKPLAKAGAWVEEDVLGEDPFIRSWMVDIADDHYEVDVSRAHKLLGWQPKHSLRTTLPRMITALKAKPADWYRANKLNAAKVAGRGKAAEAKVAAAEHAMHGRTHASARGKHGRDAYHDALGAFLDHRPGDMAPHKPVSVQPVRSGGCRTTARHQCGAGSVGTRAAQCAHGLERYDQRPASDDLRRPRALAPLGVGTMGHGARCAIFR